MTQSAHIVLHSRAAVATFTVALTLFVLLLRRSASASRDDEVEWRHILIIDAVSSGCRMHAYVGPIVR
jgi:hypothetical protein